MENIICVTGATGSIGQVLTIRLLKKGYRVRAIIRNETAATQLRDAGAEIIVADLKNPLTITGVLEGCSIVFHTAAKIIGNSPSEFWQTNVAGTSLLIDEALRANISRFVHISSIAVYGYPNERDVNEDHIWTPNEDLYITTKQAAEHVVWNRAMDLPTTIIRPGEVIGPGQNIWTTRILYLIKMGLLHAPINSGCLNPVYIENLIDAIILLGFHNSTAGHAFNVIDGYSLVTSQYIKRLAGIANKRVIDLPSVLFHISSLALKYYMLRRKIEPLITSDAVKYLFYKTTFCNNKIRRFVGWSPIVDLESALTHIKEWYKHSKD